MVAGRKDGAAVINRACEKWSPWENWPPSQKVKIFKISPVKKVQLPRQLSLRAPEVFTHRLCLKASLSETFPSTPNAGQKLPPQRQQNQASFRPSLQPQQSARGGSSARESIQQALSTCRGYERGSVLVSDTCLRRGIATVRRRLSRQVLTRPAQPGQPGLGTGEMVCPARSHSGVSSQSKESTDGPKVR